MANILLSSIVIYFRQNYKFLVVDRYYPLKTYSLTMISWVPMGLGTCGMADFSTILSSQRILDHAGCRILDDTFIPMGI